MTKVKQLFFLLLILIMGCNSSSGQQESAVSDQPDVKEAIGNVNSFFEKYKNDGTKKAIDYLFSRSQPITGVDNLKNKLDSTRTELGEFTGYEQITEKNVGNGLVLLSYLVKHKYSPIRFTFIFYRPEKNWVLYKFYFDTEFMDELQSSGKVYFIK